MVKFKNPFLIYGYESPDLFCDRKEETRSIITALKNGRNITLTSPRRIGKTGLIQNVFNQLSVQDPHLKCFYIDIFSTSSLKEFTLLLGQTVLGQLDSFSEKVMSRLMGFFKSCRPVVTADPISGQPSVMLDFMPDNAESTLREIFAYIKESGKECVIAIDEFQQITEYPEKGTEALIRSFIQFIPNVHFIFSGSKHHLMSEMFSSPSRPFYQSTQKMDIGIIPPETYLEFASRLLAPKGIKLGMTEFRYFYDLVAGHTWYIQRILNKIYEVGTGTISIADINEIFSGILNEEEFNFQRQFSLLTTNRQQLLKAVAVDGNVSSPNAKEFIERHSLGAVSSVNRALEYLCNNEFILLTPQGYQVYDRFFALWLARLAGSSSSAYLFGKTNFSLGRE